MRTALGRILVSITAKRISCIICAYNEERTIGATLDALKDHPALAEVIVVDDGSTDRTTEIVRAHPHARLIVQAQNRGKSAALAAGFAAARCRYLMVLDADLIGLTAKDVGALAEPVLSGAAAASISLRRNSLLPYRLIGLDFVSGERVFPAALLAGHTKEIAELPRWGFEVYVNRLLLERGLPLAVVRWERVFNNRKRVKVGFWRGLSTEGRMIADILRLISPEEVILQNWRMLRLCRGAGDVVVGGAHDAARVPVRANQPERDKER